MKAVYLKELKSYFSGAVSYACFALMFVIAGIYTWAINIQSTSGAFENTVANMAFWLCLLPIPLLTMRVFSEERKQKTDQLLYSLPLKTSSVVLGKYFAAVTVIAVPVAIIGVYPLILSFFGNVNLASCYSILFAFLFMSAALTAVGIFVSSLTENQIVAAILTAVIIFFNYFMPYIASFVSTSAAASAIFLIVSGLVIGFITFLMTKNYIAGISTAVVLNFVFILIYALKSEIIEGFLPKIMENISVFEALSVFAGGIFDLTGIVFFISVAAVFIFLTMQSLEKRRWA